MSNIILELIKNNSNWKDILEQKNIKIKQDEDLCIFNYNVCADFSDPYICAARGLIIDTANQKIVCYPFDKFFNLHEQYHAELDWTNNISVQEKLDGSIMKLFYYNGEWILSSNSQIIAEDKFADLFWYGAEEQGLDLKLLNVNYTYIFELISPLNQIVLKYPKTEIYHIGTRDNETGREYIEDIKIRKPKIYSLNNLKEIQEAINKMSQSDAFPQEEGFVIVDKDFRRVKIKNLNYVKYHHLKGQGILSKKTILHLIRDGEKAEYISYFPSSEVLFERYDEDMLKLQSNFFSCLRQYRKYWQENNKDFSVLGKYVKDKMFGQFIWTYIKDNKSLMDMWKELKVERYI